jgi:dipeptidyl-peptidase-4
LIEVPLSGGEVMYGLLYLPPDGISKNRPVVVNVYGGPHFQMVRESWSQTADLQAQLLAQNGVVVVKFDNRGSAGRGKSFEAPIYRAMGTVELDDQITGLSYIHSNFDTDESSVGVYGWSYGGFMTLSLLAKRSSTFKVGVAGAPVVDFRWYDTAYTERYMGTPSDNPEGYSHASILSHIEQLKAPCLIIHGLIDENVHFRNTAALLERAMQYDTELELMALPTSRHAPTLQSTRLSIVKRRTEFLLDRKTKKDNK